MLLFDTPHYIELLGWLGRAVTTPAGSALLRRFDGAHWDARGSWPYQSLPSAEQLRALRDLPGFAPLSFTAVVRPDIDAEPSGPVLREMRRHFRTEFRPLKAHLGHSPALPSAREAYSPRTRKRLQHAAETFLVEREDMPAEHEAMSEWQRRLKESRCIADSSSPDARHFAGLRASVGRWRANSACAVLRRRDTRALAGVFLFFGDLEGRSWHAHSFLVDAGARRDFGSYLLFDKAIEILGDRTLWFGGAPSGANGAGVFAFKRRFANVTAQAHILSVDLDDAELARIRSTRGTFPWLPDYRGPEQPVVRAA